MWGKNIPGRGESKGPNQLESTVREKEKQLAEVQEIKMMTKYEDIHVQEKHDGLGPMVHGKRFCYYLNYEGKTMERYKQTNNINYYNVTEVTLVAVGNRL